VIVEGCVLRNPANVIRVDNDAQGVVLSHNHFEASPTPRYEGNRLHEAVVVPAADVAKRP
jgi:hypothetical protein